MTARYAIVCAATNGDAHHLCEHGGSEMRSYDPDDATPVDLILAGDSLEQVRALAELRLRFVRTAAPKPAGAQIFVNDRKYRIVSQGRVGPRRRNRDRAWLIRVPMHPQGGPKPRPSTDCHHRAS
jgi:hypothetical protein